MQFGTIFNLLSDFKAFFVFPAASCDPNSNFWSLCILDIFKFINLFSWPKPPHNSDSLLHLKNSNDRLIGHSRQNKNYYAKLTEAIISCVSFERDKSQSVLHTFAVIISFFKRNFSTERCEKFFLNFFGQNLVICCFPGRIFALISLKFALRAARGHFLPFCCFPGPN